MHKGNRWALIAGAVLLAAIVGGIAYNAGVASGIEESGKVIAAPGTPGAPPHPYPYYGWHHRPWGPGFFFAPLLFIAFWFLVVRGLFWHGGWHRHHDFDERHRQAHERMTTQL